jgi:hypothetical protein
MRRVRAHLRHSGSSKLRFGATSLAAMWQDNKHWGWNIYFGRWFLCLRDKNLDNKYKQNKPNRFFDLSFGRGQLKFERKFMAMSEGQKSSYWEMRHPDNWHKHTPMTLDAFIEHYNSVPCCRYY